MLYVGTDTGTINLLNRVLGEPITAEGSVPLGDPSRAIAAAEQALGEALGLPLDDIDVDSIERVEWPDASLGMPEPDNIYAQIITPGYVIKLTTEGQTYTYHASDERAVFVSQEGKADSGSITIEGVQVTADQGVVVQGQSTLPDGSCLGSELWADGASQDWWPGQVCMTVEEGAWQKVVRLGEGEIPANLDRSAQYMLRAFQQGNPDIEAVLAFDLMGPPAPTP